MRIDGTRDVRDRGKHPRAGPDGPGAGGLGIRPSLVRSAHGRALLAHLDPDEYNAHMQVVRQTEPRENRPWVDDALLQRELAQTRERGYGLRDDGYFVNVGFDPGPDLAAMAVPIQSRSGIHGTLSALWMREDITLPKVLALDAVHDLKSAATRIGAAMDQNGITAPRFASPNIGG